MPGKTEFEKALDKRIRQLHKDMSAYNDMKAELDELLRLKTLYRPAEDRKGDTNGKPGGFKVDTGSKTSLVLGAVRAEIERLQAEEGIPYREFPFSELIKRLPDSIKYAFGKAHGIEAIRTAIKRGGKRVNLDYLGGRIIDLNIKEQRIAS